MTWSWMPSRGRPWRRAARISPLLAMLAGCDSLVGSQPGTPVPIERFDLGRYLFPAPPPPPPPPPAGHVTLINFDRDGQPLVRFDTDGNSLDAHDGEIERFGDLYYLYGASYGCGFELARPGTPFCGVRVYSSPDLVEWTYRGFLFDGTTPLWQSRCNGTQYGCYRPHVAYNASTRRYVLWLNTYEVAGNFRVFEARHPTGPFVERAPPRVAEMVNARNGDHNLFVDDDGKGYLVYTDWRNDGDLIVEQLRGDYLSGSGRHVRLGVRAVEAPSLFKRNGRYYLTFGDPNCGFCRTGGSYVTAPTPLGPWSARRRLVAACGGQPSHVAPLPTPDGRTVYLYQGDLWTDFSPNQAIAAHFWAPLEFTDGGEIRQLACAPHAYAPVLTGAPTARDALTASRMRLTCDITATTLREASFTAERTGILREVAIPLFRRGHPSAPLRVEVYAGERLVRAVSLPPDRVSWDVRMKALVADVPVAAGETYALRLSTASSAGCYGFAAYPGDRAGDQYQLTTSVDGGASWRPDERLTLRLGVRIAPAP